MKSPRLGVLGGPSEYPIPAFSQPLCQARRACHVLGTAAADRSRAPHAGAYRTDALPHAPLVLAVIAATYKRAT
ncbi:hypothetical protein EXIGLDRAFT_723516 [Exidia glandulosa HHB12029]|uniref:Uncharacterized protein n=1 Tax=Exidia glandulosa HHB12029 TaxID=1314781 RepID=A0A165ET19_EXIGL|nr:hypothetical protein EXIGLDRAFT_723516 [Exidia glandulosa HHB12029]